MDLRKKVLSALKWTFAARIVGQLTSWGITIIVIRILEPQDYGLMAMAAVVVTFMVLINTAGLDAVLVQKEQLTEQDRRQVFGVVISGNLLMFGITFVAAPLLADFFGEPRLIAIFRVLAIQFLLLIFETLPETHLERRLDFKRRSIVDLVTLIVGSVATLTFALAGFGVWSLVWGNLVTIGSRVIGLNAIAPCLCRPSFSFGQLKESLSFGGYVSADRMLYFVFAEADKLIGGKLLGTVSLGYYAVASHLGTLPIQKLAGLINSVAFPAFSRTQADTDKVATYLLKAVRMMSIVAFPVFVGISSVAEETVALLLGDKWAAAAPLLQVLALVMPLRLVFTVFPPFLWGIGRPDVSATNYLVAAIIMPAAIATGAQWGPLGMCYGWVAAFPVVFAITARRASRLVNVSLLDLGRAMFWPAVSSVAMYGSVLAAKWLLNGQPGSLTNLVALVLLGAVAYAAVTWFCYRDGVMEVKDLMRS